MPKNDATYLTLKDGGKLYKVDPPLLGHAIVELIEHALDRMDSRDVTIDDIVRIIRKPDESIPTVAARARVRWNKTAWKAIDVVYELLADRVRVITVINVQRRMVRRNRL